MTGAKSAVGKGRVREIYVTHRVSMRVDLARLIEPAVHPLVAEHGMRALCPWIGTADPVWLVALKHRSAVRIAGVDPQFPASGSTRAVASRSPGHATLP